MKILFRVGLLLLMVLLVVSNMVVFAQDEMVQYVHDAFVLDVPAGLGMETESANQVVFTGDGTSIEVLITTLSDAQQTALDAAGSDGLAEIAQLMFAQSDYQITPCDALTGWSCVWFVDPASAFQRAALVAPGSDAFYTITFRAPDAAQLAGLQPEAVLASFSLSDGMAASTDAGAGESGESLFNVVANGNVNLRACGATTCDLVGTATNGQVLSVLAVEGEGDDQWYQVEWEDGTAYIAGWLTTRGPDVFVDLVEGYEDEATGCVLALRTSRGDSSFEFAISGEHHEDVWVDIFRPGDTSPVRVDAQYDKEFLDTKDPYIHQVYYWTTWWPIGTYNIELRLGDATSMIAFDITENADHLIYVHCD